MPTTPPPDVPSMPGAPPQVVDYLRRLRTWAYEEIDKAVKKDEATAHLFLAAADQRQNPHIFRIQVDSSGRLTAVDVPLGGGKP